MSNLGIDRIIHCDRLIVQSDLAAIEQILKWFEVFQQSPLTEILWLQAQIALIEAFTNAVQHAHRPLPKHTPIKLEAALSVDRLEVRVWDQGAPFDLESSINQVEQDYPDPLEHEAHWGISLFKKLRDQHHWQIKYSHSHDGQNCFCFIRSYLDYAEKCENK